MKVIIVSFLLVAVASAAPPIWAELHRGYTFEQYKQDFGKKYSPEEEPRRRALFQLRLEEILMHNSGSSSYKKGVNHMTDWSNDERRAVLGTFAQHGASLSNGFSKRRAPLTDLPKEVDWRKHDPQVISAVKNQGHCGSCWAHATAEQLESNYAIQTGKLFVLSTQQLTSCMPNPRHCGGGGGCTGATVELGFGYAKDKGGLTEEWQYGYNSFFGDVPACQWQKNGSKAQAAIPPPKDFVVLPRNKPDVVMETLANVGPLAISVDASHWHDYESGIFDGCPYSKNITMNHAVQLVGYGTDEKVNKDYWIVRNSWSAKYGENGYIRVYKEKGEPECGWDNDWVTGGGGCEGEKNDVWACGQCGVLYDSVYVNFQ